MIIANILKVIITNILKRITWLIIAGSKRNKDFINNISVNNIAFTNLDIEIENISPITNKILLVDKKDEQKLKHIPFGCEIINSVSFYNIFNNKKESYKFLPIKVY